MTTTINTPKPKTSQGSVTFDFSPRGLPHSYVVGATTYVSGYYYAEAGQELTFVADVSLPDDREAIEYIWDFGDGVKGYGNPVEHLFKIANPHLRVSLEVVDQYGDRYHVARQMYFGTPAERDVQKTAHMDTGNLLEWTQTNATRGTISASTDQAYDGIYSMKCVLDADPESENGFVRGLWEPAWEDGDEISYRARFYLSSGFLDAMQGQVDLMRWDAFPEQQRFGLALQPTIDNKCHAFAFDGDEQIFITEGIDPFEVPEGQWFELRVDQRLSETAAYTKVYLDGVLKGTSLQQNFFGETITRIRYGIVAINANTQTNGLTLYVDDADWAWL